MRATISVLCILGAAAAARGDTVTFPSGGEMKGVVLSQTDESVVVRIRHGLMTLTSSQVTSITKEDPEAASRSALGMSTWEACFAALRTRSWGPDLRPARAMIIDSGPFRNVPYSRDTSGAREFSIYGDPDSPAGYEVGLSRSLAVSAEARKEAAAVLAAFLSEPKDRKALESLKLGESVKAERGDMIFEVEQSANADGAPTWWLSVYNVRALEAARVSEKDLPKPAISPEPSRGGDTVASPKTSSGKGEPQETITPFGTEPENPHQPPRRRYSGGGGHWGNWWHHHGGGPRK
jgi:hypothetical protein